MSAPLWTAGDAAMATGGTLSGVCDWQATGISIDSRSVQPGDLFVALAGPTHDGHAFVADALARGAVAALVHADVEGGGPLLQANDTLEALRSLGIAARSRMTGKVIGVTGSVGKTGTKEALRAVFARQGRTHASVASFNNHWGVPLTLARMPADTEFGVFELGMNHAGELGPLSRLVRPHAAIVTTVEPVHLEFFASVSEIADAKSEIFEGLEGPRVAVLNRDNPHFERMAAAARAAGARVVSFGQNDRADARLIRAAHKEDCSCVSADICGQPMAFKIGIPGRHWIGNSLAVLATVAALDGDLGLAGLALATLEPPKGRGNRTRVARADGGFEVIDESYNANPASMRAAIALLGDAHPASRGRRIAVLGDMRELGAEGAAFHADLDAPLREAKIDLVFCAGPLMKSLADRLPPEILGAHAETSELLTPFVVEAIRAGDVVMVKGSLGSRMGPIVEKLKSLGAPEPRRANGAGA